MVWDARIRLVTVLTFSVTFFSSYIVVASPSSSESSFGSVSTCPNLSSDSSVPKKCKDVSHSKKTQAVVSTWPIQTRIPFVVSLLGGAAISIAGFSMQAAGIDEGAALVSGGISFFFTASASLMWWYPTATKGLIAVALGVASLVGAGVILAQVVPVSPAYGWGLLASSAGHLLFNIVGWLNFRYFRPKKRTKRNDKYRLPRAHRGSVSTSMIVTPVALPAGAGISVLGTF